MRKKCISAFISFSVVLSVFLSSCSLQNPFLSESRGDNTTPPIVLPTDQVFDLSRTYNGDFTFETLHSVALELRVEFIEDDGSPIEDLKTSEAVAGPVIVSVTDGKGNAVYTGRVGDDGTVEAVFHVPSAPDDMTLTLTAAGFHTRTVEIEDLRSLSEIRRIMPMVRRSFTAQNLTVAIDSDGDGIPDDQDDFPDDPTRAFVNRVPAEGKLSIAFEDLYPADDAGDADYNDFIANFFVKEVSNAQNEIVEIIGEAEAAVRLAGYNHDFGIFIGFEGATASLEVRYYDSDDNLIEVVSNTEKNAANIVLFEESKYAVGRRTAFTLAFDSAQPSGVVDQPPYDPYIFVRNTSFDIHMIGKNPLPGSNNPPDKPFEYELDGDVFPWALLVPTTWIHPDEGQRIEIPYPRFTLWRESFGSEHSDWYLHYYDPYVPTSDPPAVVGITPEPDPNGPITWPNSQEYQLEIEDWDGVTPVYYRSTASVPVWIELDEETGVIIADAGKVPLTTMNYAEAYAHTIPFYASLNENSGADADEGSTIDQPIFITFYFFRPDI